MISRRWVEVNPVEIHASSVHPVVASSDSVRIQHWYHFEHIIFPQSTSNWVVSVQQEIQETIENETRWGLARMDSSTHEHHLQIVMKDFVVEI